MAHKIIINNLGPITYCEMDIGQFTVLTGPQSNGKSTLAKAVYFFRTIKDDIMNLLGQIPSGYDLRLVLNNHLHRKFQSLFGHQNVYDPTMSVEYFYEKNNPESYIQMHMIYNEERKEHLPCISYGEDMLAIFYRINYGRSSLDKETINEIQKELSQGFRDDSETIFIPAGRSTLTLLSDQLSFIFVAMDDSLRNNIDYCTRKYVELVLKTRQWFKSFSDFQGSKEIENLSSKVLAGKYKYVNDEERLYLSNQPDNSFVKINYTSSGQQEAVWVFNLLTYFSEERKKVFLIIEEPEAHLYPESQMHITDALSVFAGRGNSVMFSTHSPYVLGELNNLIQCGQIKEKYIEAAQEVIPKSAWIAPDVLNAFFVHDGICDSALGEYGLIMNELIDGASDIINERCDKILDMITEGGDD